MKAKKRLTKKEKDALRARVEKAQSRIPKPLGSKQHGSYMALMENEAGRMFSDAEKQRAGKAWRGEVANEEMTLIIEAVASKWKGGAK